MGTLGITLDSSAAQSEMFCFKQAKSHLILFLQRRLDMHV